MDTSIVNVLVSILNKVKSRYDGYFNQLDKCFDALDLDYRYYDHIRTFLEYFHYYNILVELDKYYPNIEERDRLEVLKDAGILTVMHSWRQHKKVYQFDPDLTNIIMDVDISTTEVNHNFWNKLPFNGMCIHISDCGSLYDDNQTIDHSIFACLDHFEMNAKIDYLSLYVLDMNSINLDDECKDDIIPYMDFHIPLVDGSTIKDCLVETISIFSSSYTDAEISGYNKHMYYRYLMRLLNILMYILSANADIKEPDPDTSTRSSSTEISIEFDMHDLDMEDDSRNVEIMEVGVNIGRAIRLHKNKQQSSNTNEEHLNSSRRGSKRIPHMRSGHWHHYWRGPRDQPDMRELIVKWVMPVFINGYIHESKVSNITPVVAD